MREETAKVKKADLVNRLKEFNSLLATFSGGVDSAFLLALAHRTLGDKVVAATAESTIHPNREAEYARNFASERGIHHIVFRSGEMSLPDFVSNGTNRCYHCKRYLFDRVLKIAKKNGIKHVVQGATLDDLGDYRPGFKAANETGVAAPLIDAQLNKEEIRFLSREMGLSTWNKPAMSCLATRIPYGSAITEEKLKMVEKAEEFLLERGISIVRVRHHGSLARIEMRPKEIRPVMEKMFRKAIVEEFRKIGFEHVALDMEGYISGKIDRRLGLKGTQK